MSARIRRAAAIALFAAALAAMVYVALARLGRQREREERPLAPALSVADLDGAALDLARLRGKIVVIDFFATWCGPCRDEVERLVALQRRFGPQGLQLVGISMDDDAAPVRAFIREHRVNYPVALGDAALGTRFGGVLGLPVKIIVDRDGRIAARHNGLFDATALEREVAALLAE